MASPFFLGVNNVYFYRIIRNKFGMSLIEILIVLTIIAGMMAFASAIIGTSSGSKMRQTTNELMRVIKYVYNQAALRNEYYRIVFDLTEQKYFVEFSDMPFYVIREGDEKELIRQKNEEDKDIQDEDETQVNSQAAAIGSFAESEDEMLEVFEMPENIKISDIYVSHQAQKLEVGKAYLYFFPKGYTQFAVIHLSDDEDERFMTLVVNPLTAVVEVSDEYIEHEELLEKSGGTS